MKLSKMKRRLTGLSMIAVMGVSMFSAGADVLSVKAAEAEQTVATTEAATEATTEEMLVAEDASTTSEEATETEVAEEIRVEAGAEVAINETNFPDSTFREYVKQFDTDNNGSFSSTELQAVKEIDVSYEAVTSLTGIGYFTALEYLDCEADHLTSLDVSKNTALTELSCCWNQLTSLDVSKNTALTELSCYKNQLTSLDVSNNTALTELYCESNDLTSLNVSGCTALTYLNCGYNDLASLDVSRNTTLSYLNCSGNQLTSFDVSKNTALICLVCENNELTSLDVSNNTALKVLSFENNELTSLDVSNNTALERLFCNINKLTSLDVSKNIALERLECISNQLTSINVSGCAALKLLWCGGNQLTSIDVNNNTVLTELSCWGNQLTSIDVSKNTALNYLGCWDNQLTNLDISKNKELSSLYCDSEALSSIDACKDIYNIRLHVPLYKKENSYYFDLSESPWDKSKVSDPEIGTYDSASGLLAVPESMAVEDICGDSYADDQIFYNIGGEKKKIELCISGMVNLDSYAEYQGYSFYEDENGDKYCLDSNGNKVINEFKCDGTYTYYFQADGTAMMDRLTYHPDGVNVIYFDEEGHEVFSNFHEVKKSIAGDAVDDLCFFDVYGYMYVDVMTYGNAAFGNGDKIYYINPYGVIERNGWFGFSETCVWAGTDKKVGMGIGYANADGSLMINQNTYYNGNLVYMQGDGHMK